MEGSPIRNHKIVSKLKKATLLTGAGALIIASPASVAAQGDWRDNGHNSDESRTSQVNRDHENRRWYDWQRWFARYRKHSHRHRHVSPETCQAWQERLNQQVATFKETSEKDLAFGASYYMMLQTFVNDQQLTVENYEFYKAKVDMRQVAATNAVNELEAPDLNCEDDANATVERAMNSGDIKDAKQAMERYQKALKQLTKAVRNSYDGQMQF